MLERKNDELSLGPVIGYTDYVTCAAMGDHARNYDFRRYRNISA